MQHRVFIKVSEFHGRTTAKERTTRESLTSSFFFSTILQLLNLV